jgi:hypothetical protein
MTLRPHSFIVFNDTHAKHSRYHMTLCSHSFIVFNDTHAKHSRYCQSTEEGDWILSCRLLTIQHI